MSVELPAAGTDDRAALHRALGDATRLTIVDALQLSDRSPTQLAALTGVPTNLLAFHLNVLEDVGLIVRSPSQGDARRRYIVLRRERLTALADPVPFARPIERVLFLCSANAARSQLAASLWHARTGLPALSAGTDPADRVHPLAVAVARGRGIDLSGARPSGFDAVTVTPDLVVSVCDRAHEATAGDEPAFAAPRLHWSVPDPAAGDRARFEATFDELDDRIRRLTAALPGSPPPRDT